MSLTINGSDLELVSIIKLLGAEIEHNLSFTSRVEKICELNLSQRIGILKEIRSCLTMHQRLLYYNAMIKPVLNYVTEHSLD